MTAMGLHDRISKALRSGDLRGGGLLFGEQPHASKRRQQLPRQRRFLTTSVAPSILDLFRDGQQQAVVETEILGVAEDWCCWVLSYRVDTAEHRLFLPLVGMETRVLIEDAPQCGIGVLFTSSEDDETLFEVEVPTLSAHASTLLHHWRPNLESSAPDRLLQTMDILLSVADDQARSVDYTPLSVTVTVVIPEDLQRGLSDLMPEFPFT